MEITKLSLWIKTAEKGKQLTDLDGHIKCGNSLIDTPAVDAKAFCWKEEFADVFDGGGFQVILGNPPYIKLQNFKPGHPDQAEWIEHNYLSAQTGNFDMYLPFIERGLSLLHPKGVMGFIAPSLWLLSTYGEGPGSRAPVDEGYFRRAHEPQR